MPAEINLDAHAANVSKALDDLFTFVNEQHALLPNRLYHFTAMEAIESILQNDQMWASHAYDMNDERELWYGANLIKFCLEEKQKMYAPRKIFQLNEFFEMALERANPYTNNFNELPEPFVISLCEDGSSATQWEKYGKNGYGGCLHFEANQPAIRAMREKNLILLKVIYDAQIQISLINAAIQKEIDHILSYLNDPFSTFMGMGASIAFDQVMLFYTIAFKSKKWSDEQEWRLVRGVDRSAEPIEPETRPGLNGPVRFTRVDLNDFRPWINVIDIAVGSNVSDMQAARTRELLNGA